MRGSLTNATKNSPASSRPRVSLPSVKLYPRRSIRTPSFCVGCASRTCESSGDQRLAVAALRVEVRLGELGAAGQRRARRPWSRPTRPSCSPQRRAVPRLDAHPDPARDEERAAGEPRGGDVSSADGTQTCFSRSAFSSALTFAVPSLKPNRLRGVSWAVLVDEVRPYPSCVQRMRRGAEGRAGQVADRVHGDLRVVGARLHDEVAVAARGVEGVGGEVRQRRRGPRGAGRRARTGPRVPSAGVPTNIDRPKPNVIVRPAGSRSAASPVSSGGASYGPRRGPNGPAERPCVSRAAIVVQALQQRDQLVAGRRRQVERGEVQPVLRGGDDAGLVHAGERVRAPEPRVAGGSGAVAATDAEAGGGGETDGEPAAQPEEPAPRDAASVRAGQRARPGCRAGSVAGGHVTPRDGAGRPWR